MEIKKAGALLTFIVATCIASLGCSPLGPPHSTHPVFQNLEQGVVPLRLPAAHRGLLEKSQENTAGAITQAINRGVPFIEVDVRRASDATLFLYHDHHLGPRLIQDPPELLGRTADSLTLDEITAIQLKPNGEKIALLSTALDTVRDSSSVLLLDLKGESKGLIDSVMNEVQRLKSQHSVIVQCQALISLAYMRLMYPHIAVLYRVHHRDEIGYGFPHQPEIIQIDAEWTSPEVTDRIHEHGSRVLVKTLSAALDRVEVWNSLFAAGVDIVLTDKAQLFPTTRPTSAMSTTLPQLVPMNGR